EVDPAEGRLQRRHRVDEAGAVAGRDLEVVDVDVGELLEQAGLALHHRLAGERPDVAEPQDGGPVRDDGDPVAARRVVPGQVRLARDLEARLRDAGRVGQRQIALRDQRLRGNDLELSGPPRAVVLERVVLSNHAAGW